MNQMHNQMNQFSPMGQMHNPMTPMNSLNSIASMGSLNQVAQMNPMNPINQMSQMSPMNSLNQMNEMNPMNAYMGGLGANFNTLTMMKELKDQGTSQQINISGAKSDRTNHEQLGNGMLNVPLFVPLPGAKKRKRGETSESPSLTPSLSTLSAAIELHGHRDGGSTTSATRKKHKANIAPVGTAGPVALTDRRHTLAAAACTDSNALATTQVIAKAREGEDKSHLQPQASYTTQTNALQ